MKTITYSFLEAKIKVVSFINQEGSYSDQRKLQPFKIALENGEKNEIIKEFNNIQKANGNKIEITSVEDAFTIRCLSTNSAFHYELPSYLKTLFNSAWKNYDSHLGLIIRQIIEEGSLIDSTDYEEILPLFGEENIDPDELPGRGYLYMCGLLYKILTSGLWEDFFNHLLDEHPRFGYY